MTVDAARAFVEHMKSDEAFRDRILGTADPGERETVIRAEGFDCTLEEVEALNTPLSDAELEMAGGYGCIGDTKCDIDG